MNDCNLEHYLDYMRAHIRAQDPRFVAQLSNMQLHDTFHMLARPRVSFREWLERTGRRAITTENTEGTANNNGNISVASVVKPEPQSEAQIEAQNAKGLAALRALEAHGFPVSISAES